MSNKQKQNIMKKLEFLNSIGEREFDARETLKVLTHNWAIYASWGVQGRPGFYNGKALVLNVNGRLHSGKVVITLAWDDTYTVRLVTNKYREIKKFEMVYFDVLTELIDNNIETPQ